MISQKNKVLINFWQDSINNKISNIDLLETQKKFLPPMIGVVFSRDCAFKCKHCIMPHNNSCDLKFENLNRIDQAIEATLKTGVKDLVHTGRILKKEHLPILKKYLDKGMRVSMIDNGMGKRLISDIKKMNLFFNGGIDISIDGEKEEHERMRGAGTFEIAVHGAKALAEVASHISITSTASKINYKNIANDIQSLAVKMPYVRNFNLAITSPAKHHLEKMDLTQDEMRILFRELVDNSSKHPVRLVVYLNKDMEAIMPELKKYKEPVSKYIHLEWKINNLTIAYFPPSLAPVEEYALDANGLYVLPYGFDYYLESRPNSLQMNDDLILSNPKESYRRLSGKYFNRLGEKSLEEERKIFGDYFRRSINS